MASVEKIASRKAIQLREDQKRCIEDLASRPYLEACAGVGKSIIGSLIISDVNEASVGMRKKLFFLTPNCDHRRGAMRGLRQGMVDPLEVMGFGRPAEAALARDDPRPFDEEIEKRLEDLTPELQ